ncbi:coenzyme Q-binding protein COQ10 homolog A, mitochondrial isoform X2 [Onthophagus taurus]|uniref:coenzyme Q-binding protein COQ10 homolog A, mitochondrial isoform X2 n=1 Tax=Onthophagus taurus TaxID=166361 RepID=UPI000C1FE291|nr:coenzyme Q-binding protein COQ10 homolog A, mitochondrial isoform X2 [Onthophagus taurus]
MRTNGSLLQSIGKSHDKIRYFFSKADEHKKHHGRKLVGFSMEQMFTVVSDVANYKSFVPFCKGSTIICESDENLKAVLHIGFPPIFESYVSDVTLSKPNMVRAVCKDGRLFDYLETYWKFSEGIESNPQSSIVDFSIDFRFKSTLHLKLANMFFDALVGQMETAFLTEAKRRYGAESIPIHELSYVKT